MAASHFIEKMRERDAYGESAPGWALTGERPIEESKRRGEQVVACLARWYTDKSSYPNKVRDLVPHYLDRLPRPWNQSGVWFYQKEDGGRAFMLEFAIDPQYEDSVRPHPRWSWDSRAASWSMSQ